MQIRPLRHDDLDLLIEIDSTISDEFYLHVDRTGEGLLRSFRIETRRRREPAVRSSALGDELMFSLRQIASQIEEGLADIAEHEGMPVGLIAATWQAGQDVVDLLDLRIDFDHRRQGLASALLFRLINASRDRQARAIRAHTLSDNVPAASLLAKLGFEIAGLDTHRNSNHDLVKEQATLVWYLELGP